MANKNEASQRFVLFSTITGAPYIDPNSAAHAYLSEEAAKKADIPEAGYKRITGTPYELYYLCYKAGAHTLTWHTNTVTQTDALREQDIPIEYYNHALCNVLARIKEFRKKSDMYLLGNCEFLVPAKIEKSPSLVQVIYGIAQRSQEDTEWLYLAFSTLEEYELWRSGQPEEEAGRWNPLRLRFSSLREVCGRHGILLNPSGNRLVIPAGWIADVHSRQQTAVTAETNPEKGNAEKEKKA